MNKKLLFLLLTCSALSLSAKVKIDSLLFIWNNSTIHDTTRLEALQKVAWDGYLFTNPDSTFYYSQKIIDFATLKGNKKYIATGWNIQGASFSAKGDYYTAIKYYEKSLEINEEINDKERIAAALGNLGIVYKNLGDLQKALEYYQRSLKINQELQNRKGVAKVLNNIGILYKTQEEYNLALEYYTKALQINKEDDNKVETSNLLNAIGNISLFKKDTSEAFRYYQEALEIQESTGDKRGTALTLINIGNIHNFRKEYDTALELFNKSLIIRTELNDKKGMAMSLGSIGSVYSSIGQTKMAISYFQKSLSISNEIGLLEQVKISSEFLYKNYRLEGNTSKALESYETYITLRDSLQNNDIQKELIKQQYQSKADSIKVKREMQDAIALAEQSKKDALNQKESERKSFLIWLGAIGSVVGVFFTIFIFNKLRLVRQQKGIIENQKHEVEEKNKEITDSIKYAKRIQKAILPPDKIIKKHLPDSFILYKPKDIVAGDFYWMENVGNKTLFAAADCTGHGVPGAMVSVVCNNGLNRSVREHGLTDPGMILDKTREIVISEFEKSEEEVKDGMDIALCSLENNTLKFAGANNPIWMVRNDEIIETKANKQPIGKFDKQMPFTTHEFEIMKGDIIYIFSDGLVDQFGGDKGKKFKATAFRELILSIKDKTMDQQKLQIDEVFEAWKGDIEQIDDVCVIGVRF